MPHKTKMWYITLFCGKVYVAERDDLLPRTHQIKIRAIQASAAARQFKRHNIPHNYVRMLEQDLCTWFEDKKYHKEFMKEKRKAMNLPVVEVNEGQELDYFAEQARQQRVKYIMPTVAVFNERPQQEGSVFQRQKSKHA